MTSETLEAVGETREVVSTLDELLAIEQIKQLKSRYFRFVDTKDRDGLASVFTEDAVFDARTAFSIGGTGDGGRAAESNDWVYTGNAVIADFIRGAAGTLTTVHHGHGHEIEVLSATEARGVIAMEDHAWETPGDGGVKCLHGWGHYHEEYRKVDGRWRIRRSKLTRLNVMLGTN